MGSDTIIGVFSDSLNDSFKSLKKEILATFAGLIILPAPVRVVR